tara:strand:- start:1619 stop:2251 length:633 start_codon:yes stop_codon:yes gene_type:complete
MKKFLLVLMLMALPAFAEQGPEEWVWGLSTGNASSLFATGNRHQFVATNTSWYATMTDYNDKVAGTSDWAWIASPSKGWQYSGPTRDFTVTYYGSWNCNGASTDAGYGTGYRVTVNRDAGSVSGWTGAAVVAGPVLVGPSGCAFGVCLDTSPQGSASGTVTMNNTDVLRTESNCTVSGGTPLIGGAESCDTTSCTGRNGEKDSQLTVTSQ